MKAERHGSAEFGAPVRVLQEVGLLMAMRHSSRATVFAALAYFVTAMAAEAHPHVFVVAKSELIYAPDGSVKAVRHAWTFDEMFSAFATQGLDKDNDGKLTREELAELAKVNVTSLKEFDYFSVMKSGDKPMAFDEPVDYWLEADANKVLTLHFTLPVKAGAPKGALTLDIYDPTYFVAFSLVEEQPVTLKDAPAGCTTEVRRPENAAAGTTNLSESYFNSLSAASNYGSQFANRISVRCK